MPTDRAIFSPRDKHYWSETPPLRFNSRDDGTGVTESHGLIPIGTAAGGGNTVRIRTAGSSYT